MNVRGIRSQSLIFPIISLSLSPVFPDFEQTSIRPEPRTHFQALRNLSHHLSQLRGQSRPPSLRMRRNKCKLLKGPFSLESKSPFASAGCPKKQFSKCTLSQEKSIFCFCDLLVRSHLLPRGQSVECSSIRVLLMRAVPPTQCLPGEITSTLGEREAVFKLLRVFHLRQHQPCGRQNGVPDSNLKRRVV